MIEWEQLGHEELEREYSPSSCVPDIQPFLDAYAERSRAAWARSDVLGSTLEVAYGPLPTQTFDLAVPDGVAGPVPVLVFVHGGYWQVLSKAESRFASADCLEAGFAHAVVDYTLAPDASLEQIIAECRAAVTELARIAPGQGIDPERIIVSGSSAGAHLAAMVALDEASPHPPAAAVLLSGVFELTPLVGTYINDAVGMTADTAAAHSPLRIPADRLPPTLLATGSNETEQFKCQTAAMSAHLDAAGVSAQTVEITGRNHFDIVFDLCDPESVLGSGVIDLVRSTA